MQRHCRRLAGVSYQDLLSMLNLQRRYRTVMGRWQEDDPGVLRLPSGRLVRGRGLRQPPPGGANPEFGLYLQSKAPPPMTWPARWVPWRDHWLPADDEDLRRGLEEVWRRAPQQRVEVACSAGIGRTGTALACLAILEGVPARAAVAFVRQHYHPRAVENPWQRRLVRHFEP